jgi:hypothetical protein
LVLAHLDKPAPAQTSDVIAALEARLNAAMEAKATTIAKAVAESALKQATSSFTSRMTELAQDAAIAAVQKAMPTIEAKMAELNARIQAIAALEGRVTALEAKQQQPDSLEGRIAALESRIAALEGKGGEGEDKQATLVKAPFVVVDGAGRQILRVDAGTEPNLVLSGGTSTATLSVGANPALRLKGDAGTASMSAEPADGISLSAGSGALFQAGASGGEGMHVKVASGDHSVDLLATGGEASVDVTAAGKSLEATIEGGHSGFVATSNGQSVAELSDVGSGYRMLIGTQSGAALQAGFHKDGKLAFGLYNNGNPLARIEMGSGGQDGVLKLFERGQEAALLGKLSGSSLGLRVLKEGNDIFAGFASTSEPNLWLAMASMPIVSLSVAEGDDAGEVELFRGSERKISVSAAAAPGLRVFGGAGQEAGLAAYLGEDGIAGLALHSGNDLVASLGASKDDPDGAQLTLFQSGQPAVIAGPGLDGGAKGVQIFDKGDTPTIELVKTPNTGTGLFVTEDGPGIFTGVNYKHKPEMSLVNGDNTIAALKELEDVSGWGSLTIHGNNKPRITLQPGGTSNPSLKILDEEGKVIFGGGVASDGQSVFQLDGAETPGIRMWAGQGTGVNVYAHGDLIATLNSVDVPGKGLIAVYDGGHSVARLGTGTHGGGNVTTTDPAGDGVFSAGFTPDGPGTACVNHKGIKCLGIGLTGLEGFH